jgi:hypothetical protein
MFAVVVMLAGLGVEQKEDLDSYLLERINFHRKTAGVAPVVLDPALTKGCLAHGQYLAKNADHPSIQTQGLHAEDPKLPGYSDLGLKAAKASVIFQTGNPRSVADRWMASLFHRLPLIDPTLSRVGIAYVEGGKFGGYAVVDSLSGRTGKWAGPVVYPADKQTDVPLEFQHENPDPIPESKDKKAGYPVTVGFPREVAVRNAQAVLKDAAGKEVPVWVSTPEKPAASQERFQRNSIALIAQAPLEPETKYSVTVSARVNNAPWAKTWTFTTGKAKQ